jgi:hypothetical protein
MNVKYLLKKAHDYHKKVGAISLARKAFVFGLRATPLSKAFDAYFARNRFSLAEKDLRSWKYSLLKWIPEAEHQFGRLPNLERVFQEVEKNKIPGDIIEFGSFQGLSIIWLARFRDKYGLNDRKIIAVDSFEGLPESSTVWTKGHFNNTSLELVRKNIKDNLLPHQQKNIEIVQGWFSAPEVKEKLEATLSDKIALCHIDCDLRSSCNDALQLVESRLLKNSKSFVLFDDWGCHPDEIPVSWNEFLKTQPQLVAKEFSHTNLTRYFSLELT